MAIKTQSKNFPALLSNHQYSGTLSTLLYNWPIFGGSLFFGLVGLGVSAWLPLPWNWLSFISGLAVLGLTLSILVSTFIVYDWGTRHEYDRLAELGRVDRANVLLDITCGKLRGSRGLLSHFQNGHYFLIDIYDPEKMTDTALSRARQMEPPLQAKQRIYHRPASPDKLPLPHQWANVIFCDFSLHELSDPTDRDKLFAEFARVLKPDGRLLIAEHGRGILNFLAFGPGVFSYFPPATWQKHIEQAGLTIEHHERWRGLVHLWVVVRKPK